MKEEGESNQVARIFENMGADKESAERMVWCALAFFWRFGRTALVVFLLREARPLLSFSGLE